MEIFGFFTKEGYGKVPRVTVCICAGYLWHRILMDSEFCFDELLEFVNLSFDAGEVNVAVKFSNPVF